MSILAERTEFRHLPTHPGLTLSGTELQPTGHACKTPDPIFPTSADYAPLPEPAQSIRAQVLRAQGTLYLKYARDLRAGVFGMAPEAFIARELARRVASWRAIGNRSGSWWAARHHLHPIASDWAAPHICSHCLRPDYHLDNGLCRTCEPILCCEDPGCGRPAKISGVQVTVDALALCDWCADHRPPVEPDGEPVDAEADVTVTAADFRRVA